MDKVRRSVPQFYFDVPRWGFLSRQIGESSRHSLTSTHSLSRERHHFSKLPFWAHLHPLKFWLTMIPRNLAAQSGFFRRSAEELGRLSKIGTVALIPSPKTSH